MLVIDGTRFVEWTPKSEEKEFHPLVKSQSKEIFGEDSIYFDIKTLLKSASGIGSIPDAYVLDLSEPYSWYVVENELSTHPIYEHIVSQLTRFINGLDKQSSRTQILEMLYNKINEDDKIRSTILEKTNSKDIYRFLSSLLSKNPSIVVIIDEKTAEVEEACKHLTYSPYRVQIIEFSTFINESSGSTVYAHIFEPLYNDKITAVNVSNKNTQSAMPVRSSQPSVKEHLGIIADQKVREFGYKLLEEVLKIADNVELRTSSDHINFFAKQKFCSIYPEKGGFGFEVKIPIDELKNKNLNDIWRPVSKGSSWSYALVKDSLNIPQLIELSKIAYQRNNK
ncbi:MAG: hypothetical protein QM398_02530 [Thermoproteota archaeon]|jgi:predicted transport protein|nr:hypothetical protein [Thermoproteota archaeon]NLD65849.1 hypothetical protein [Thermoproteota archaeon]